MGHWFVHSEETHNDVIKWKHFPRYLPFCEGNPPMDSPHKRPVTRSVDVFFGMRLNKRLSKQSRRRWFETPPRSLWRHCNVPRPFVACSVAIDGMENCDIEPSRLYQHKLTHWRRVTHICVSELTIIGSDNGLSPGRRQAIIWTNDGILLIGSLGKTSVKY